MPGRLDRRPRLDAHACTPSPPVHLHPAPAYAGPAPPDCTWRVPARAPFASQAHARGQQLQQVAMPASRRGGGAADA